jgi:hypothetical protein
MDPLPDEEERNDVSMRITAQMSDAHIIGLSAYKNCKNPDAGCKNAVNPQNRISLYPANYLFNSAFHHHRHFRLAPGMTGFYTCLSQK